MSETDHSEGEHTHQKIMTVPFPLYNCFSYLNVTLYNPHSVMWLICQPVVILPLGNLSVITSLSSTTLLLTNISILLCFDR